jgi:MYXO-CTERM domain-containing protein
LKTTTALGKLTRYVVVTYKGEELRILVMVKAVEDDSTEDNVTDKDSSGEGEKGCRSTVGGAAMLALLAVGALCFKRKQQN